MLTHAQCQSRSWLSLSVRQENMRIELPFSKWSEFPLWFRILVIVAVVNFLTFTAIDIHFGGSAMNGYQSRGSYFIGSHGSYVPVTKVFWTYSYIHGIAMQITHLSIFAGLALILNLKRYRRKAEQGTPPNRA